MNGFPALEVEKRRTVPRWLQFIAPIISLVLALVAIGIIFQALGIDPLFAYEEIFNGAFGSSYGFSETVVKSIPLMLTGIGLTLAFRARFWNIGAEGQLLIGATCATGLALAFPDWPRWLIMPLMFIIGFIGGALWGIIPALLKARWRVDEVITSLMLVYIASNLVNYLVYGPWKGPEEMGFPYTSKFSEAAQLPRLSWTRIHYPTLIIGIVIAVVIYLLLTRTKWGYEIRVTGENPSAARYAGMSYLKTLLLVMIISGGLAGLAGVGEVAGIHFRLRYPEGISPGYGFTAIIVAWLARLNPIGAVLTSLLLGGLLVGGDAIQISLGLPGATIFVFNGTILLFVLGGDLFARYRIRVKSKTEG
ncbi:MAG: ABC transporter permease [Anaerolineaceae bacterium]|nr:MAG: ABC transporter permease [Anaerolineaceae bacterium]